MKKIAMIIVSVVMLSSCGAMSRMSYEDAYNVGYGVGTVIRNL